MRQALAGVLFVSISFLLLPSAQAANTITSASYIDANNDGTVDNIKLTFDENITQCNYEAGDWTVNTAGDINVSITGINTADPEGTGEGDCNNTDAIVYLSVTADAGETSTVTDPIISYADNGTPGDLQDSGTITAQSNVNVGDGAAPALVSFTSSTGDGTYGPSTAINITANYTEAITAGSIAVTLNNLGTATLSTSSGSSLTGTYTVGATGSGEDIAAIDVATITAQSAADGGPNVNSSTTLPGTNITGAKTIAIDTTAPTVALTYSDNPAGPGLMTITATYSEDVTTAPTFSVNQQGSTDIIGAAATTGSAPGSVFTYDYTVNTATGGTYIDGSATVVLSATADAATNASAAPTNNSFTIDTTAPTILSITPDTPTIYTGDLTQSVAVVYSETMNTASTPAITAGTSTNFTAGAGVWSTTTLTDDTYTVVLTHNGTAEEIANETVSVASGATDEAGNTENTGATSAAFAVDTQAPTLTQTTPVTTPTTDNTPDYVFSSDENGTAAYGGSCLSANTAITSGGTTATLDSDGSGAALIDGTYTDCTIVVTDSAGNTSSSLAIPSFTVDTTAPAFASAKAVSDTVIEVTFDEAIGSVLNASGSDFSATGLTITAAAINGGDNTIVDLTVNSLGNTGYTATDLAIAINAVDDLAGNSSAASSGDTIDDAQVPVIQETFTFDNNGNGKIDKISILFSETMDSSITTTAPVTVAGYTVSGFNMWDTNTVTNDLLVLDLTEIAGLCDLNDQSGCDTDATPTVTVTGGTYADLAGNNDGGGSGAATDKAIPVIVGAKTADTTANGQIDAIEVQFSEDLNGTSVNNNGSDFTVAGYTVTAASELTGLVTLTLTESGSDDTGVTPLVSLTSNVNDLASPSNSNSSDSITPTDGAAPFIDAEVAVTDPTNDNTPTWGFDSSEAGTIAYSGDCSSATTTAVQGTQTVDFNTLSDTTHSNCSIIITDGTGNASSSFPVTAFTVDTSAPSVVLSYSADPAKAGVVTITTTYDENISTVPNFTVNQPGTADIIAAPATTGTAPGTVFTYDYTVTTDDGASYIDGTATVSLSTTTDIAGNTSSLPTNDSFTIDTTPPATPVAAPDMTAATDLGESNTDNLTADNTPDFTMSCTIGNTVELFANATSKGTVSCTTGTVTMTSAIIPSATYTMTYTETDAAGNVSGNSPGLSVTIDTAAPTIASVTVDTNPVYTGDLTQTVTVLYSESMDAASAPAITAGTSTNFTAGAGVWSMTINTNDTYTVVLTHNGTAEEIANETVSVASGATDAAGNAEASGLTSGTFVVDTQAPTLQSFTSSTADGTYGPTNTVNITATYDENVTGTITVDLNNTVTGVALTCAGTTTCTGTYTVGATGSGEDIAAVDVNSIASESVTDDNGNSQTGSSMPATTIATASTIKIDTTTPTLQSFTSSTADGTYGPTNTVNITATYDENIANGSTVVVVLDNGETVALSSVSGMTISGTYTVGATGSGQDSSDLTVASITTQAATDTVGNTQTGASLPATNIADGSDIVIDTTAPAQPTTAVDMEATSDLGASNSDDITSDNTPDFSGVCTNGNTVTLYVDNVKSTDTLVCASNVFTITSSTITDGGHTITFTETDAVGNESAETTNNLAISIDTDVPDVTVNQKGSQADPTNTSPVVFTVIFDENMDTSTVEATDFTITGTATVGTHTLTNTDAQNFELSVPVTADGTVIVSLAGNTATDIAGNNNNASTSTDNTVTVDTVAPTGTTTVGTTTIYTGDLVQEVTVTYDEPMAATSSPTITFAGQTGGFTSNGDGIWTSPTVWTETFTFAGTEETTGVTAVSSNATDVAGNSEAAGTNASFSIDTVAPTFSSAEIANGTPTQLTTTFSEAVIAADNSGFGIKAAGLDRATNTAVAGSGTTNITFTLTSDVFEAGQIVTVRYAPGAVTDAAGNTLATFGEQPVTNNIEEGSAILQNILLTSDSSTPSSAATITWDTLTNVNGVGVNPLNTNNNEIEYGTSMTLGSTQATSTGDGVSSHTASLTGLSANTVYYYRVKSVANGKTSYSQIFSFTTARGNNGLYTDNIVLVKSTAKYDATNPYTNGWHFRFEATADSITEQYLRMKMDNWVSGTNNLATSGNVKMLVSSNGQTAASESAIAAGTGIETTYGAGTTVDINGVSDNDPNKAGKQFVVDIYVQIPSGQAGGAYSTGYGIANQATDSAWSSLD